MFLLTFFCFNAYFSVFYTRVHKTVLFCDNACIRKIPTFKYVFFDTLEKQPLIEF